MMSVRQYAAFLILPLAVMSVAVSLLLIQRATQGNLRYVLHRDANISRLTNLVITRKATPLKHAPTLKLEDVMQKEQDRRQRILKDACLRLNISTSGPVDYSHMLVSDANKIIFNFIPKVSCTTWKKVMRQLRGRVSTGHGTMEKYSAKERAVRLARYRKVLFVREPVSRILSAYMSKFCAGTLYDNPHLQFIWERMFGRDIVKRYRGLIIKKVEEGQWLNITLNEFATYVSDLGSGIRMNQINDHWLPQHKITQPCQIKYDFIGHFENLSVEGPYVLRRLGVDHLVQFPDYHNSNAVESLTRYYKKVPLDVLQKLGEYYDADYRIFGYSLEDTVSQLTRNLFHNYQ